MIVYISLWAMYFSVHQDQNNQIFCEIFFKIEKFTKKAFQRRVARRYAIKHLVSRLKQSLKKFIHFGVVATQKPLFSWRELQSIHIADIVIHPSISAQMEHFAGHSSPPAMQMGIVYHSIIVPRPFQKSVGTLRTRSDLLSTISDNFNFHFFNDFFTSGSWIWSRLPPKSATIKS